MHAFLLVLLLAAPAASDATKALENKIDQFIAPYVEYHVFSGVILIAKGDQVLINRPFGNANYELSVPNTPDTRFPVASITKRFTQVILHRLKDEKKLAFDDPLSKYVPDFPSADKITIDHLMKHRSGIRDPEKLRRIIRVNFTTDEVVAKLESEPLGSVPGETYSYTTANYAVLAHIIEKVTGKSFAEVIRQYVYEPAGMRDSGELTTTTVVPRLASGYMPDPFTNALSVCGPEDTSWKAAGGSSYSTTGDLHRYLRAFYGGRLLKSVNPGDLFPHGTLFEKKVSRSSGSFPGANAQMMYFPDDEVSVVVLANNYAPVTGTIAETVAAIYFDRPWKAPVVKVAKTLPAIDPRMLGSYSLEGLPYSFTISVREGRPTVKWNEIRQEAMLPMPDGSWFLPLDWATLTFPGRANGDYREGVWVAPWAETPRKVTRKE